MCGVAIKEIKKEKISKSREWQPKEQSVAWLRKTANAVAVDFAYLAIDS